MEITLLHSAQVEESRAIVQELGGEPAGSDVTVNHEGRDVRIVSKHALAAGVCPNFSAYPAVVVTGEDGTVRVKSPVGDWAECLDFIDNPPVPAPTGPARKVDLTRLEFLDCFTDQEKVQLKSLEATDPVVGLFWEEYRAAASIRLDDPRTVKAVGHLASLGYITEARKAEILGG
jgi:hypothetical protein